MTRLVYQQLNSIHLVNPVENLAQKHVFDVVDGS